jgi:hypothetical protein
MVEKHQNPMDTALPLKRTSELFLLDFWAEFNVLDRGPGTSGVAP